MTDNEVKKEETAADFLARLSGDTVLEILPYLIKAEKEGIPLRHIVSDLVELVSE